MCSQVPDLGLVIRWETKDKEFLIVAANGNSINKNHLLSEYLVYSDNREWKIAGENSS